MDLLVDRRADSLARRPRRFAGGRRREAPDSQINFFWIIVAALELPRLLRILYLAFGKQIGGMLDARRERIEQGLRDAEQARQDRESARAERPATLAEARREANDILARAQKVAQETRDADIAATREELERHARARDRRDRGREAAGPRRAARRGRRPRPPAAGSVVGETMTDQRQRRLVEEFLAEPTSAANVAVRAS